MGVECTARRLSARQMREYRAGRDRAIAEFAGMAGVKALVINAREEAAAWRVAAFRTRPLAMLRFSAGVSTYCATPSRVALR
jgi:hypothetical protein